MRYNKIRKMDIADGPGIRVSIFMQGCTFNCKNCFNPETHDFSGGKEFTDDTINRVIELADNDMIEGLSILGGEPMHPKNIQGTTELAKKYGKKVIAFSGCVTDDAEVCNAHGIDAFFPILRGVTTLDEALDTNHAYKNLSATAYQVFRLLI